VKQAIDWLKGVGQEIRDARMAPLTKTAAEVWGLLRQESNVELGPVRLEGSATKRHVTLDVTVDGVESKALSVMGASLICMATTTPGLAQISVTIFTGWPVTLATV
jgi:hypothetical protein